MINLLTLEGDMDLSFDPKKVSIDEIYGALKEMGIKAVPQEKAGAAAGGTPHETPAR